MNIDEPFFREWRTRATGERRSIERAAALLSRLDLDMSGIPVLTVVGSKGKGTAAAYASAYLRSAGRRVLTITSPGFRSNRERIRVDGRAVTSRELATLGTRIDRAAQRLPRRTARSGYLSPSGLFVIAGMLHAGSVRPDVIVLEAGRGGRSDEARLFPPRVVLLTPIMEEHLDELGPSIMSIARDKAGIVSEETRAVLSAPQRSDVFEVLRATVAERSDGRLDLELPAPGHSGVPASLLPDGLGAANAEVGCLAAQRLLDETGPGRPEAAALRGILSSVRLPGRLSHHLVAADGAEATEIILDAAVNRAGVAAAVAYARVRWGHIDHVLLSLPDDKELDGTATELAGLPVGFVTLDRPHLAFTRALPREWARIPGDELTTEAVCGLGRHVLVLGTISFAAVVLDLVDAETDRLFTP